MTSRFPWKSVGWKVSSCVFFAFLNALLKSSPLGVWETVFIQNLCAVGIGSVALRWWVMRPGMFLNPWLVVRSLFACAGVFFWTAGVKKLSLFQVVSLGFLGPLVTTLGARFFLKEELTTARVWAIFLGCLGSLLVSSGSHQAWINILFLKLSLHHFYLPLLPILAALCFSLSTLTDKKALRDWSPEETTFSLFIVVSLGSFLAILFGGGDLSFSFLRSHVISWMPGWAWLISLGGVTVAAHLCMNKAFAQRDLTFLMPFGSTRPVTSALLGYFFFQEALPTLWMWIGSLFIIGSVGVLAWAREKKSSI